MYKLLEYYEKNNIVYTHLSAFAKTEEEIERKKLDIAKGLKEMGIQAYEIFGTKNIQSMKKMLKRDNVKIFQVVKQ